MGRIETIDLTIGAIEERSIKPLWEAWARHNVYGLLFQSDIGAPVDEREGHESSSTPPSSSIEEAEDVRPAVVTTHAQQIAMVLVERMHVGINLGKLVGTCELTVTGVRARGSSPFGQLGRRALSRRASTG